MSSRPYGLAVKAIVTDEQGRSLVLRRAAKSRHYAGQWEWPGGKVDPGEDFSAAVGRETEEETGLGIEITGFAGASDFELPQVHVIVLYMTATVVGGALLLSDEHDAFQWVPMAGLCRLNLADNARDFVLQYAEREGTTR